MFVRSLEHNLAANAPEGPAVGVLGEVGGLEHEACVGVRWTRLPACNLWPPDERTTRCVCLAECTALGEGGAGRLGNMTATVVISTWMHITRGPTGDDLRW